MNKNDGELFCILLFLAVTVTMVFLERFSQL